MLNSANEPCAGHDSAILCLLDLLSAALCRSGNTHAADHEAEVILLRLKQCGDILRSSAPVLADQIELRSVELRAAMAEERSDHVAASRFAREAMAIAGNNRAAYFNNVHVAVRAMLASGDVDGAQQVLGSALMAAISERLDERELSALLEYVRAAWLSPLEPSSVLYQAVVEMARCRLGRPDHSVESMMRSSPAELLGELTALLNRHSD